MTFNLEKEDRIHKYDHIYLPKEKIELPNIGHL